MTKLQIRNANDGESNGSFTGKNESPRAPMESFGQTARHRHARAFLPGSTNRFPLIARRNDYTVSGGDCGIRNAVE
jgi:hypothetical protein